MKREPLPTDFVIIDGKEYTYADYCAAITCDLTDGDTEEGLLATGLFVPNEQGTLTYKGE